MLSLQRPKLKPPQQINKHREADLPRTPYPIVSKGVSDLSRSANKKLFRRKERQRNARLLSREEF